MNKIRKSLSICVILCMVFLTGCDSEKYDYSEMKKIYNCIDSVVDYSIKADAKMSNILISYIVEDGTTVGKFVYQPMVVDGSYLIMEMLAEYIE